MIWLTGYKYGEIKFQTAAMNPVSCEIFAVFFASDMSDIICIFAA